MRATRAAICAAIIGVAGIGFANSASAVVEPTAAQYTALSGNPAYTHQVTITRGGFAANTVVFVQQCVKTEATPPFDQSVDCSAFSTLNPSSDASGNFTVNFNLFSGDEPNLGEWACATPASCFVRLAPGEKTNINDDVFYSLVESTVVTTTTSSTTSSTTSTTIVDTTTTTIPNPDPVVPESPFAVLLPVAGAGLLAGAYAISRKRRAAA